MNISTVRSFHITVFDEEAVVKQISLMIVILIASFGMSLNASASNSGSAVPMQMGVVNVGLPHFDADSRDWNLLGGHGARRYVKHVKFPRVYNSPPQVIANLKSFDIMGDRNPRLAVMAENVTRDGFDLVVFTWWDTWVYGVGATWIAIP